MTTSPCMGTPQQHWPMLSDSRHSVCSYAIFQNEACGETKFGMAYGAGVEVMLDAGWRGGIEYLHVDLGKNSVTGTALGLTGVVDDRYKVDTFRVKLSKGF